MNQVSGSLSTDTGLPTEQPERRRLAFFDIAYLLLVISLYAGCLFSPLLGIVLGIALMSAGATEETRRVGRVCLILGIANAVLVVITMIGMIAVGGVVSRLPFKHYWEGL